ncbi:MAG: DUF4054 domain-containing protein [Flavobacterium sp.]
MNVSDITVDDFKTQFYRFFKYLPTWSNANTYNIGDVVYYDANRLFYTCKTDGTTSIPTTTANWCLKTDDVSNYILDADIESAFAEAGIVFNTNISATDAQFTLIFLYLAAHFLVLDMRAAGLQSGNQGIVESKQVGNVSIAYMIPEWMKKESLSFYTTTYYGYKYLAMTRIYRIGNVFAIRGNGPYNVPRNG